MVDLLSAGGASLKLVLLSGHMAVGPLLLGSVLLEVAYLTALVVFVSGNKAGASSEVWLDGRSPATDLGASQGTANV